MGKAEMVGPETDKDGLPWAAARAAAEPGEAFLDRIAAEAARLQPAAPQAALRRAAATGSGQGLRGVLAALGGWWAAGGLAAAVAAGFWIGVSDPGGLLAGATSGDSVEFLPTASDLFGSATEDS